MRLIGKAQLPVESILLYREIGAVHDLLPTCRCRARSSEASPSG